MSENIPFEIKKTFRVKFSIFLNLKGTVVPTLSRPTLSFNRQKMKYNIRACRQYDFEQVFRDTGHLTVEAVLWSRTVDG